MQTIKALTQRCEIAEAEVKRLAEESARLRQQYSEASDEVIQVSWIGLVGAGGLFGYLCD